VSSKTTTFTPSSFNRIPAFRLPRNRYQSKTSFPSSYSFPGIVNVAGDSFGDLVRLLNNNEKLAKRVIRLQQQYPYATLPELITIDWLNANNEQYIYQFAVLGGRWAPAGQGMIPDFLVFRGDQADAWLIQGEYWHSLYQQREFDKIVIARLTRMLGNELPLGKVIELWEDDIYRYTPTIFELAKNGIQWRN
jgi:hypothetical protein